MKVSREELARSFATALSHLIEVQRRVVTGAMSAVLGRGGKTAVAEVSGVSRNNVIKAEREVVADIEPSSRQRAVDGGGSNGHRVKMWRIEVSKVPVEIGLEITVCHYPSGTSKWNENEHKMFSFISMNWRGRPLISYRTITELISAITSAKGLTIGAEEDLNHYETRSKVVTPNSPPCPSPATSSTGTGTGRLPDLSLGEPLWL